MLGTLYGRALESRSPDPLLRDEHAERHDDQKGAETSAPGGGETILVVEDNPVLRRLVVMQLTTLGYRVREAENAAAKNAAECAGWTSPEK